jgi:endoglucanase
MHSPVEVLSLADIDYTIRLLTALMPRLAEAKGFIPN